LRSTESFDNLSELSADEVGSSPVKSKTGKQNAPIMKTLSVKIMEGEGSWNTDFALNTREAFPFETDLFKGEILLLVRPPNLDDDPYWSDRIFRKKKRRIVFNFQGKFKRPLRGPLFTGGEITSSMNLSLWTRGIFGMLIKLMENGFSDLRYSFGDDKKQLTPRIAVPAHKAMERLVVTPEGDTPPAITGEPFDESKEARNKRLKTKDWEWDTSSTYSFSFFSMYLSFADWKLVNLPVSPDINLRRLWNDSDFRLVMYEWTGQGRDHPASSISYALNVNFCYLGDRRVTEEESSEPEDFEDIALDSDRRPHRNREEESESGVRAFYRSESNSFPAIMEADSLSESDDEEDFFDANSEVVEHAISQDISTAPSEASALLSAIDTLVPAWIHVASGKGHYTRTYAINQGERTLLLPCADCDDYMDQSEENRSVQEHIDAHFSSRLSSHERDRRCLGLYIKQTGKNVLERITEESTSFHDIFLKGKNRSEKRPESNAIMRGFTARALSDRQWEEEWLVLSAEGILLCFHPEKQKIRLKIQLSNVRRISSLPTRLAPKMHGWAFLCIETLGRCIYFLFESSAIRDQWQNKLSDLQAKLQDDEQSVESDLSRRVGVLHIDQPGDEFLHKSTMWACKNRRILNSGLLNFKQFDEIENPIDMIKEALVLSIQAYRDESGEIRHLFFKSAGALKRAMVRTLSESGRLAFFLNLYHCMIMHAFLVLGPPGSGLKWISFFNNLAYEVDDDLLSISELEHCIVRAKMAHPSQFMSRFVIPKSEYRMALTMTDFRINFALNPGSVSGPPVILVYSPESIDQQLDEASRLYLDQATVTQKGSNEVILTLPRICQWYLDDFGASQNDLARKIVRLLKAESRNVVKEGLKAKGNVSLRFSDFSFKCRPLSLL
jgi:hypothetical protein